MIADMDEISKPNSDPPITAMPLRRQSVSNTLQSGKGLHERDEVNVTDCVHGDGGSKALKSMGVEEGPRADQSVIQRSYDAWESVQAYIVRYRPLQILNMHERVRVLETTMRHFDFPVWAGTLE
jgi:hypothetical protein